MDPIHGTEPVTPSPIHGDSEFIRQDEKALERPPDAPPIEPDTGKILDTYA